MATVAVLGGGYGGITVAKSLDAVAEVTLIEQRDKFVHHSAVLRAAVDEIWEDAIFMSYQSLLQRGRIHRGTVAKLEGNTIYLFGQEPITADYIVIATGSMYPFPAKHLDAVTEVTRHRLAQLHHGLHVARKVLIVGGGLVGLEMAGELKSALPKLEVIVLERESEILPQKYYIPEFRNLILEQAKNMGIEFITNDSLESFPLDPPAVLGHFTVKTRAGRIISADMWFQCYGARPVTGFLTSSTYRDCLSENGAIKVQSTLQLVGYDNVYAIGDVTDVAESKRADAARSHARVVVSNIADQIDGQQPAHRYRPSVNWVVLPLGPKHGATQLLDNNGRLKVEGAAQTVDIKGNDLMVSMIRSQLNLP